MKPELKYWLVNAIVLFAISTSSAQTVDSTAMNAMLFDGSSTYAYLDNSGAIESRYNTPFSVEAWFRSDDPEQTMTITSKTDAARLNYHFLIGIKNGVLRFVRGNKDLLGETAIVPETWNHVTATYDGGVMRLYLNGQFESLISAPQSLADGYNYVEVGAKPVPAGRSEYWDGSIEELKFWGESKTDGDVILGQHRIQLVGQGIAKSYFQFNQFLGASSNEIHDAYGEKVLIFQNGVLTQSDCPIGASNAYQSNQTNSQQEYYGTDVFMEFSSNSNHYASVNAMLHQPNTWNGIDNQNEIMDDRFWMVDWTGNPADPTITFVSQSPLPEVLNILPENAKLYRRELRGIGGWTLTNAVAIIDTLANSISYVISAPGQYAVVIQDGGNITTQLRNSDCNRPATTFSNVLTANSLNGPDQYEFVVYNVADGFYDTLQTTARNFKLKHLEQQVRYGKTYTVKVRGVWGGVYGPFGAECTVTTIPFPTTQLEAQFWWATVNMKQRIKCESVAGVTQYIFNVSNDSLGFEQEYVSDVPNFKLKYLAGPVHYSETYELKVRSVMLGDTSAYGPSKTVYTDVRQLNRLRDGYCDTTDIRKSTYLKAETVHFVDEYQFRVVNVAHGVDGIYTTTDKRFKLREIAGTLNCGITYAINVRTIMNGDTTAWGDTCFVTTENLGCRLANPNVDEATGEPAETEAAEVGPIILGAYPNPFNRSVNLNFETEISQRIHIEIYDAQGRLLKEYPSQLFPAGVHQMTWDGRNDRGNDCMNGTYIVALRNNQNFMVKSIRLLLKR